MCYDENEAPSSSNTTAYLSWLLHSEDIMGGKFTGEKKLFSAVNMKNCGSCNVRKHKYIKGSDKYVTFDISLKFDSLDKMKITSSESKGIL